MKYIGRIGFNSHSKREKKKIIIIIIIKGSGWGKSDRHTQKERKKERKKEKKERKKEKKERKEKKVLTEKSSGGRFHCCAV